MTYRERADCRLCGGGLRCVLDLGRMPLANALLSGPEALRWEHSTGQPTYPLYLSRCEACGHVQLPVVVDPKLLFTDDYPYRSATSPVFRAHLEKLAQAMTVRESTGLVVEVGSNDGYLLDQFRARGWRAIGVDPARGLASASTARGSLSVPEFFDEEVALAVRNACGPADVVVANNVFAHADDLGAIARGVKSLLAPKGTFVFEVAYLPRMLERGYFDSVYHEHLSYHHAAPLREFLARHGLLLYGVHEVDSQGGSIRCFAKHIPEGDYVPRHELMSVITCQDQEELCTAENVEAFARRVEQGRAAFRKRVGDLVAAGKRVAAFGCPAKATTLLHYYGLGREEIRYAVEENPAKQGKFSPGKRVPIVAPERFDAEPVDAMVCLAWNFADDIKRRYAHWPVEWIVPFESNDARPLGAYRNRDEEKE